jgi:hypothetical protein
MVLWSPSYVPPGAEQHPDRVVQVEQRAETLEERHRGPRSGSGSAAPVSTQWLYFRAGAGELGPQNHRII